MSVPKLSISMITYNHQDYIAEAIESVLSQKVNFDYELVIGEDYSKDNTRAIIEDYCIKFPGKIKLIDRGKNVGSTKNFFDTILQCRGEYIAMLDGDDVMLPGKLQAQVDFLDRNKDFVMVAHPMVEFEHATGKVLRIVEPQVQKNEYYLPDFLKYGSIFGNSSKMFRRSAIPFSHSNQQIFFIADMYLTLMVIGRGKAGWLKEMYAKYRRHDGAMMRNLNGEKVYKDEMYTLKQVREQYGNEFSRYFSPRLASANLAFGMQEISNGNKSNGRSKIWQSITQKPNLAISQYIYLILSFLPSKITRLYEKIIN